MPPAAAASEVLREPVGMVGVGQPEVGMDVDDAGQDQQPGRVDHLGAIGRKVLPHRPMRPSPDRHVRAPAAAGRDDRAADDDPIGHASARSAGADLDRLRTLPEHAPTDLGKLLLAADQRREVVPGQRPDA